MSSAVILPSIASHDRIVFLSLSSPFQAQRWTKPASSPARTYRPYSGSEWVEKVETPPEGKSRGGGEGSGVSPGVTILASIGVEFPCFGAEIGRLGESEGCIQLSGAPTEE